MSGPVRAETAAPAPDVELEQLRKRLNEKLERMSLEDFGRAAGIHPTDVREIAEGRVPNGAEQRHITNTLDRLPN